MGAAVELLRNWIGVLSKSTEVPESLRLEVLPLTFRRITGLNPDWVLEARSLNMAGIICWRHEDFSVVEQKVLVG